MGLQKLLLAAIVLVVIRVFTFILPIPASSENGTRSLLPTNSAPHPALPASTPGVPAFSVNNPNNPVQDRAGKGAVVAERPNNPAQNWSREKPVASACQSVGAAVVTVHAGREIGSGSVVSSDGLVITNNHIVRRLGDRQLFVEAQNGSRYDGQVLATDRRNDLALIQLQVQDPLPTVRLASSEAMQVGQPVCAIGSPYGQAGVITEGKLLNILPNGDLQSDVILKPGNSGGPLLNQQSEVIGVNKGVAKSRVGEDGSGGNGSTIRTSYATSATVAREFIEQNRSNPLSSNASPTDGYSVDRYRDRPNSPPIQEDRDRSNAFPKSR